MKAELRDAVFRSSLSEVADLIARGAPVDQLDRDGRTPLIHAAIDGLLEILEYLIASGANVDHGDKLGWTALHSAVQGQHVHCVDALLKSGATPDSRELHGNTPLSKAVFAYKGDDRIIRLLLNAGADPNLKNKYGVSPKDLAETKGDIIDGIT